MSRAEDILQATIDRTEYTAPSESRIETLLIELKNVIEQGGSGFSDDYAKALSMTINDQTFVVTAQLIDQNGNNLGNAQTIDLPLESVVVGGSYNDSTKKVVLTLQNGNTVEFSVADLVSGLQSELSASNKLDPSYINYDSTHRAVSDTEKSAWNGKQDALTTAQLNAVNSGITSTTVSQITVNKDELVELVDSSAKNKLAITKTSIKTANTVGTWSGDVYTINGVDITINNDLSFIINGTASDRIIFNLKNTDLSEFQGFVLSGGNINSETTSIVLQLGSNPWTVIAQDFGSGVVIGDYDDTKTYALFINISKNTVINELVVKPMICKKIDWDISNKFVPYTPSLYELYTMIQMN